MVAVREARSVDLLAQAIATSRSTEILDYQLCNCGEDTMLAFAHMCIFKMLSMAYEMESDGHGWPTFVIVGPGVAAGLAMDSWLTRHIPNFPVWRMEPLLKHVRIGSAHDYEIAMGHGMSVSVFDCYSACMLINYRM